MDFFGTEKCSSQIVITLPCTRFQDREAKNQAQLDTVRRQALDAAVAAEERRRLDVSALVARMNEAEGKADAAIEAVVAEHSAALKKVGS